ncbi:hypothetical protein EDL79_03930 [Ehrlichia ruminantium]|uniref:Uncharacterized protein n=1 Tax=Ehrlichia ruminantium TaxID=779 RepID=A0AAE6UIQ9_EHRRU|nr:hypothetical protein [Ehrlichia ruminantium]QGR02765.1 hypothetical protein EDL81_03920 [Ehrlichia ruminantium]QGR03685.1 hypothetical protein EDL80_03920 [Ehrlichia ruminantium]QGR04612.1 hypothetical protein EDL79_03930 [Ehrlichia ruminantium]
MMNEGNDVAGVSDRSYAGFKVSLGIDHTLEDRLYAREVMGLLKTEQEKFEDLKTFLVIYERDLQFYKLLTLVGKALRNEDLTVKNSKQSPAMHAIMKSIMVLLKGKEVLFNNEFVRKLINYEVIKVIEFISQKEEIHRVTNERILQAKENSYLAINEANKKDQALISMRSSMSEEDFTQRVQEICSEELEKFSDLVGIYAEAQSDREMVSALKEKCIPNMTEILSSRDHVSYKLVVGLMQKLGKISGVDMVYVKRLVKYLVLDTSIPGVALSLLRDKLQDSLRNVLLGIQEHFVNSEEESKRRNSRRLDMEKYQHIASMAEPFLYMMLPTKDICDICQEISDTLTMHFQKINKEIEFLLSKTWSSTQMNYKIVREKVLECISSNVRSAYSVIEQDADMSTWLTLGVDQQKLLDLCSQRDIVLDRMDEVSRLSSSAKDFPKIVCDFLTDDCVNYERALLESRTTLKQMYQSMHQVIKLSEVPNDTVVILKDHITCVNHICEKLEQDMGVLKRKPGVMYPTAGIVGGSRGMCCLCLCNSAMYMK